MVTPRRDWFARRSAPSAPRRGLLLVMVLVTLAVVMTLFTVWVRTIVLERGLVRTQLLRLQSEYLAASGVSRARAQLAADGNYQGETWRPATEIWQGRGEATVTIRVSPSPDQPSTRVVRVEAEWSISDLQRARRIQMALIELKPNGAAP